MRFSAVKPTSKIIQKYLSAHYDETNLHKAEILLTFCLLGIGINLLLIPLYLRENLQITPLIHLASLVIFSISARFIWTGRFGSGAFAAICSTYCVITAGFLNLDGINSYILPIYILLLPAGFYFIGIKAGLALSGTTLLLFLGDLLFEISSYVNIESIVAHANERLLAVITFFATVIALAYFFMTSYRRQEKLIARQNIHMYELQSLNKQLNCALDENKTLLKEIHHRIKNNLNMAQGLLSLHMTEMTDRSVDEVLSEFSLKIDSIILTHEHLYRNADCDYILFDEYIQELITGIFSIARVSQDMVRFEQKIDALPLEEKLVTPLGLIVSEAVTNSLKYAFPNGSGIIRVSMRSSAESLHLIVEDNGTGLPSSDSTMKNDSFGFRIMNSLAEQIGGSMQVCSPPGSGTTIIVEFPLSPTMPGLFQTDDRRGRERRP